MAAEMLSITAPRYTDPSGYQLSTLPQPTVTDASDVMIRVHAASVNPVDVKKAGGVFKMAVKDAWVISFFVKCWLWESSELMMMPAVQDSPTRLGMMLRVWWWMLEMAWKGWVWGMRCTCGCRRSAEVRTHAPGCGDVDDW